MKKKSIIFIFLIIIIHSKVLAHNNNEQTIKPSLLRVDSSALFWTFFPVTMSKVFSQA